MAGMGSMLCFAAAARALSDEARRLGLQPPGFRSPPGLVGVDRSLRRRPGGVPAVAVRVGDRPITVVAADMVEGVVVANGLSGAAAADARDRLLAAVHEAVGDVAA
jgi:hypothetical protein